MTTVVPMKKTYERLLVRAVFRHRVHYRPLVIECTMTPCFTYTILSELFKIYTEEDWMVSGSDMYHEAMKLLEQKVSTYKDPVLEGYFITVWPTSQEILVRDLKVPKKAAAS